MRRRSVLLSAVSGALTGALAVRRTTTAQEATPSATANHPIIGAWPAVEGLYLMTGDSGSSFKTAPATGVCLTELMLDGASKLVDLTPFRPSRFAEGKPWVDEFMYDLPGSKLSISR